MWIQLDWLFPVAKQRQSHFGQVGEKVRSAEQGRLDSKAGARVGCLTVILRPTSVDSAQAEETHQGCQGSGKMGKSREQNYFSSVLPMVPS